MPPSPDQPGVHAHVLLTHRPWAEHELEQTGSAHASPLQPEWHAHVPARQSPWPEQPLGQETRWQRAPCQPGVQ